MLSDWWKFSLNSTNLSDVQKREPSELSSSLESRPFHERINKIMFTEKSSRNVIQVSTTNYNVSVVPKLGQIGPKCDFLRSVSVHLGARCDLN